MSTALKSESDKGILHSLPRRGKRGTLSLRGTALKRRGPNRIFRDALIVLR